MLKTARQGGAATVENEERSLLDQVVQVSEAAARYMPTLSVQQFSEREKMLRQIKELLVEGTDYGVIPGTKKPTLLKPGAEKICAFFGYAPHYEESPSSIEDWGGAQFGEPLFYYKYSCVLAKGGVAVGEGVGSCNSWESKYRYRSGQRKCPACGAEAIITGKAEYGGGFICFAKKGGCGAKFKETDSAITGQSTGRVANAEIFDVINTVQKMGQKRAYIAATLSATGASQYFTQDVEDMPQFSTDGIDTGGHPVGTQAAGNHVRDQKLAAAKQPQPADPPKPAEAGIPDALLAIYDRASDFNSTVAVFHEFKSAIVELTGAEADYYRIIGAHDMKHGNELRGRTRGKVKEVIKDLFDFCANVSSPPPIKDDSRDDWVPDNIGGPVGGANG